MKLMFHKIFIVFLFFSLFSSWLISGAFCPSCIEIKAFEHSYPEACEPHSFHEHSDLHFEGTSHHQHECQHCNKKSEKFNTQQRFVFTLPDKSRTEENHLTTTTLAEKAIPNFQFIEIGSAVVSSNSINPSLESLHSIVMLE